MTSTLFLQRAQSIYCLLAPIGDDNKFSGHEFLVAGDSRSVSSDAGSTVPFSPAEQAFIPLAADEDCCAFVSMHTRILEMIRNKST